jgi:hypothetical protein
MLVTMDYYLLAFSSLGEVTQIGSFLFYAVPSKVAKASKLSVAGAGTLTLNFEFSTLDGCMHPHS